MTRLIDFFNSDIFHCNGIAYSANYDNPSTTLISI